MSDSIRADAYALRALNSFELLNSIWHSSVNCLLLPWQLHMRRFSKTDLFCYIYISVYVFCEFYFVQYYPVLPNLE